MNNAVLYARVSSKEQEKEGYSIPAQFSLLHDYAQRHNLNIIKEFHEAETAKKSGREQFQAMIKFLEKEKQTTIILVEKTDRLYRNFKDYIAIDDLINSYSHEVHLVKEGEVIGRSASSHTKLIHGIKVVLAKNYIDNLSEECQKGTLKKLELGGWAWRAPYGYTNYKKEIIVDPEAAKFVRAAFELYGTNIYSLDRLRQVLFKKGYIYKEKHPLVPKSMLEYILKNSFYIGEMEAKGQTFQGNHEPLVSHEVWIQAQRALRKDGKPRTFESQAFRYSGLLFCEECKRAYVGERKKNGKFIYYRCVAKKQGCSQGYVNQDKIDAQFNALWDKLTFPPDLKEAVIEAVTQQEALLDLNTAEEEAKVDAEIARLRMHLRGALHEKLNGNIDEQMWQEVSKDFQERIRIQEAKRAKISILELNYAELAKELVELPEFLSEQWFSSDDERRRNILNIIGSNYFLRDGKLSYKLKEPFSMFADRTLCLSWWRQSDVIRTLRELAPTLKTIKEFFVA